MHLHFMNYSGVMHEIEFQVNLVKSGKFKLYVKTLMSPVANVKTNKFPLKIQILPPVGCLVLINSILCTFEYMHLFSNGWMHKIGVLLYVGKSL